MIIHSGNSTRHAGKSTLKVDDVPCVPSGKLTVCELENGPIEIVDLLDLPHFPE